MAAGHLRSGVRETGGSSEAARQVAEEAIATARERGDRRAEASALRKLSSELRSAHHGEEAARAAEQATQIDREVFELGNRQRAEAARQVAEEAIATARERGDRRAEASALRELSSELRSAHHGEEAAQAAEQAMQIDREERARGRVESASHAVSDARARGDRAAEALALLTLGQALVVLQQPEEAEPLFEQAEHLAYDVLAATRQDARSGHSAVLLAGLSTLKTLGKALRDAERYDAARHVTEQASQLDPTRPDATARAAEGNRIPNVTNSASGVEANWVIQVGVLHGDLTVNGQPLMPANRLQVSVTTEQNITDHNGHLDTKIHVFVEAFTAQAVILRHLRPVVVREFPRILGARSMSAREFEVVLDGPRSSPRRSPRSVGLDQPSTSYDASLDEQLLNLDGAFAVGTADFPFYVTASKPEYFVIVPRARHPAGLYEWRLELDWSCLGQHGTETIDHGNRPFLSAP